MTPSQIKSQAFTHNTIRILSRTSATLEHHDWTLSWICIVWLVTAVRIEFFLLRANSGLNAVAAHFLSTSVLLSCHCSKIFLLTKFAQTIKGASSELEVASDFYRYHPQFQVFSATQTAIRAILRYLFKILNLSILSLPPSFFPLLQLLRMCITACALTELWT